MDKEADPLGYWVLDGTTLLSLLRRVRDGEDPDQIYLEEYANADHEYYGGDASDDGPSPD